MDDEDLPVNTPEAEAESADAPELTDEQPETDDEVIDTDSDDEEEQAEVDDTEDVEYEGKTYRLPPELKGALLRQADYTAKTQEIAEARKGVEAATAELEQRKQTEGALDDALFDVRRLDATLEDYRKVDWAALQSQDPERFQQLRLQYDMLRDERERAAGDYNSKVREWEIGQQRATAKQAEQARVDTAKLVPDWTDEKANKLTEFAKSLGFTDDRSLAGVRLDPRIAHTLYLADIGKRALEQRRTKPKKAAQPEPKPVPAVSGRARTQRGPQDTMDTDRWMRERNRQVDQKRKAG